MLDKEGVTTFVVKFSHEVDSMFFVTYTLLPNEDSSSATAAYLLLCNPDQTPCPPSFAHSYYICPNSLVEPCMHNVTAAEPTNTYIVGLFLSDLLDTDFPFPHPSLSLLNNLYSMYNTRDLSEGLQSSVESADIFLSTKKKYKPVALKVKQLQTELPECFYIQ